MNNRVDNHAEDREGADGDKEDRLVLGDELKKGLSFLGLFYAMGDDVVDVGVSRV